LAKAKKLATEQNTSVPAMLRDYLQELTSKSMARDTARRQFLRLSAKAKGEVGPRSWTRDDLYGR
jgi:hypothetical protein